MAIGRLLVPGADYIYTGGSVDTTTWMRVPIFYSGCLSVKEINLANAIASLIGVVFEGIHCIAWSFDFSSHTEQLLWRLSVISMVIVPALIAAVIGEDMFYGGIRTHWPNLTKMMLLCATVVVVNAVSLAGLLYTICRAITVTLVFRNLASLPSGAYQIIPWTQWIPHI
jgi:hypothetical protein